MVYGIRNDLCSEVFLRLKVEKIYYQYLAVFFNLCLFFRETLTHISGLISFS